MGRGSGVDASGIGADGWNRCRIDRPLSDDHPATARRRALSLQRRERAVTALRVRRGWCDVLQRGQPRVRNEVLVRARRRRQILRPRRGWIEASSEHSSPRCHDSLPAIVRPSPFAFRCAITGGLRARRSWCQYTTRHPAPATPDRWFRPCTDSTTAVATVNGWSMYRSS